MSSYLPQPIDSADISIIRAVLRHTGFRYEEPMCELDRGAARHALDLYQQGLHTSDDLILAVSLWGDEAAVKRQKADREGM